MSDGMEEIIEDFITEAEEYLEKIDPLFVELEEKGHDQDLLNSIFRSMHTIKGAAGFLGFQQIVDVAHKTETLMKKLRDDNKNVTSYVTTIILNSVDMLKILLAHLKAKDDIEEDINPLLKTLDEAYESMKDSDEEEEEAPQSMQEQADSEMEKAVDQAIDNLGDPLPASADETKAATTPDEGMSIEDAMAAVHAARSEAQSQETEDDEPINPQDAADAVQSALAKAQEPSVPTKAAATPQVSEPSESAVDNRKIDRRKTEQRKVDPTVGPKPSLQTLRVDVDRIDKVMNLTGEIVLVRNRLLNISGALDKKYPADTHVDGLQEAVSFLDLVTSDIQLAVMKMRMQPIKKVFGKFPRLVRDISQNLGKDVHLNISGEDTEVDRTVIERIGDPLVHIIRNAIDHGIEPIEERKSAGKPTKGQVDISAFQQGSMIMIEVSDDGRGINIERVRAKAISTGLISEEDAQRLTDKEAVNLIFLPGFSTVDTATELSGRGVGMDVVKTNIAKLNGYVEIITNKGEGSTMRISIPLTLAIIQALMVRTAGKQYAIPLGPIEETLKVGLDEINNVAGNPVLSIREKVYPLAELTEILQIKGHEHDFEHRYVLVIAVGDRHFCIGVDELLGQEEVVIKAIEGIDTDATGILGATITGEGKIVLILDPSSMSRIITGIAKVI